ncbi:PQQ-binding-like beta-propeller repeat protein [Kribbella sp. NPDC051770]|uniref:outer membrane protein assembly factor BamB family protein n=1 Tax=Kribbella sp. NPDC051770 TaxID=3155413 RepID=UPI003446FCE1
MRTNLTPDPSRRRFLGLAGLGLAGGALLPAATAAATPLSTGSPYGVDRSTWPAYGTENTTSLRFAVITDTHADVVLPDRSKDLNRMLTVAQGMHPDFVLHCGDITDYGVDDEFAMYRSSIPAGLWDRIQHVPGNHESRWSPDAFETYRRYFGPEWSSFELHGLRVVGMAPMQMLEEPGLFGADGLDHVSRALRGRELPTAMFLHYPLGADNYYVNDTEDFLDRIAGHRVRAIFAGHIHRQQVAAFNGLTQVAMRNTFAIPSFYWVERSPDGSRLDVTEVAVPATGTPTSTAVTTIPLGRTGPGEALEPHHADLRTTREAITVSAAFKTAPAQVIAQVYPQNVFSGSNAGTWVPLVKGKGNTWQGELNATALPLGEHRVQLRAIGNDGAAYDRTLSTKLTAKKAPSVAWTKELNGAIQGALLPIPDGFVAATAAGEVQAFSTKGTRRWHHTIGAVHRAPALMDRTVLVPSADHRLYAFDAAKGSTSWSTNLHAPVLSSPLVTKVDGQHRILVTAGGRLYCLDARGRVLWSANLNGLFAGQVACDGTRVFAGGGDGKAHAFDARTGAELWAVSITNKTTPYQQMIYGAWSGEVELLPDGSPLIATVSSAMSLDPTTGATKWTRNGSYIYTPSHLTAYGLLLIDEQGNVVMADPANGATRWTIRPLLRAFESGPAISRDGRTAWLVGTTGLLTRIDLANGTAEPILQVSTANTFSTPVLVADHTLVIGFQDGVLRAVTGL